MPLFQQRETLKFHHSIFMWSSRFIAKQEPVLASRLAILIFDTLHKVIRVETDFPPSLVS